METQRSVLPRGEMEPRSAFRGGVLYSVKEEVSLEEILTRRSCSS